MRGSSCLSRFGFQRKRTKGWKMPENTVYVGRPTKWGNPFKAGDTVFDTDGMERWTRTADEAVALYRQTLPLSEVTEAAVVLCGKNLACWCPLDQPCHADVLLEIANAS
ncbi:MAG: DUF4326 domain-containing protein [Burkholderiales bacterium]